VTPGSRNSEWGDFLPSHQAKISAGTILWLTQTGRRVAINFVCSVSTRLARELQLGPGKVGVIYIGDAFAVIDK